MNELDVTKLHVGSDESTVSHGSPGPRPFGAAVNYQLVKIHVEGGLGRVWAGIDPRLHREVAIKELLPSRVKDEGARRRFLLEAQVTGQLTHPHIVPIY